MVDKSCFEAISIFKKDQYKQLVKIELKYLNAKEISTII